MRKNINLRLLVTCLFAVIFCATLFVSCKQSAKSRLVGKWKINGKATVAKMDEETKKIFGGEKMAEQLLSDIKVEYKKNGTYVATNNETGTWSVSEDDKTLTTTAKGKKEEKMTIVEVSGTQFVVNNVPNISTPVIYEAYK